MSKDRLQKVIDDFSESTLVHFFRECGKFAEAKGPLPQYNSDKFTGFQKLGAIEFDDRKKLVVVMASSVNDLTERSGKKAQYEIAKKILRELTIYDSGIFIFYDSDRRFRFSLIYTESEDVKLKFSNFRRFTYFVSSDRTNNTFRNRVGNCTFSSLETIKDAFSVEKVTKEFYRQIADWYFWAVQNVTFPGDAEAEDNGRNIAVIRLITRLIFIWFMKERKLVSPDLFNRKTMSTLLKSLKPDETTYYKAILQNLFFATLNTRIDERKFRFARSYHGKNNDYMDHGIYRYEDYFKNREDMLTIFKDIPFLNGGLFDCLDWSARESGRDREVRFDGFSDREVGLHVPNYLFFSDEKEVDLNAEYGTKNKKYSVQGLLNILSAYNFTIDENDPYDQEVALDPELLGKVFENLLASFNPETATTARKSTGSYYTPREIVDYMVTESLKQYYKTHLGDVDDIDNKLEELLSPVTTDEPANPFNEVDSGRVVKLTEELRIVDPAVGSGAFPMGILNRLVSVLARVDHDNNLWREAQLKALDGITDQPLKQKLVQQVNEQFSQKSSNYGRKLYLIQKCIYGVDIQQIAIEIAKLRFFIALLVDEQVDKSRPNWGIEPLPNLDFKLMQGNSLISEFMGINLDADDSNSYGRLMKDETDELIAQFQDKKNRFQYEPDRTRKETLKKEIDDIIVRIFESKLKTQKADYFTRLKKIENKYAGVLETRQRNEAVEKEIETLNRDCGFNLAQAEKQLKEFTSGLKVKPFFAWKLYFAEVFYEKGGFDIAIANPPYGAELSRKERDYLESKFSKNKSQVKNSAIYFVYRASELLHDGGVHTFIIPKSICYSLGWNKCANVVLQGLCILIDTGKAFEEVKLEQVIFVKVLGNQATTYINGLYDGYEIKEFAGVDKNVFKESNVLLTGQTREEMDLIKKIIGRCKNKWVDYVSIVRGLNWQSQVSKKCGTTPIHRGAQLSPYFLDRATDFIDLKKFNRNEYQYQLKPKILNQLAPAHVQNPYPHFFLQAALDLSNSLVFETISCTFVRDDSIDIEFLLAINNSKLFAWLLYKFVYSNAIRSTRYDEQYVGKVPCPNLREVNQKPIIAMVDQILVITKDSNYIRDPNKIIKVTDFQQKIDGMIYELYQLIPQEIALVEGKNFKKDQ